jgi:type IV pilus assembly protein PilM
MIPSFFKTNPLLDKIKDKFAKESLSIGIDAGTATAKLIKLRSFKNDLELAGFDTGPSSLNLTSILKEYSRAHAVRKANLSLSGPATIIRYVSFPKMKDSELRQALKFEAEKHIPFAIQEVHIDGAILKDTLPDNKMLVLLAAAKKEAMNQRLKAAEEAGIKVSLVSIDSIALINAFVFNYNGDPALKGKTVALLNIGSSFSNLDIVEDGIPRFSRDFQIAGNNFTQKIADTCAIDFKPAELLKLNPDQERSEKVTAAVEAVLSNLAAEVRLSFDYYESQNASSITKIFLSGAGSLFPGLKGMLAELLGIEADHWDPLKKIKISAGLDEAKIRANVAQLPVAVGLALQGLV